MGKYITRKNIGWVLAIALGAFLFMSASGKLFGNEESFAEMGSTHIASWMTIIGIGEVLSVILFIIPRTMKLGTVLLSAYFGGAIMYHMAHPDPAFTAFTAPAVFLILVWVVSWVRGNELIELDSNK